MRREGFEVARCTVARLMGELGLQGEIRGKPVRTTISDKASPCPLDRVYRQFHAPKRPTMPPSRRPLWRRDSNHLASGKLGAVQNPVVKHRSLQFASLLSPGSP
jgi:transposase InsO family protein